MSPVAIDTPTASSEAPGVIDSIKESIKSATRTTTPATTNDLPKLPPPRTLERLRKAGIDICQGYPFYPVAPEFVQDVHKLRTEIRGGKDYVDPATRADPNKRSLFAAAKEVNILTTNIGTEIVGLQLASLTDQQKDELALLVAERSVVFFRDQDLSPQKQRELGVYLGDGEIEIHPQVAQVPGVGGGISLIWPDGQKSGFNSGNFRHPYPIGTYGWHSDLVHEAFPPAYTDF